MSDLLRVSSRVVNEELLSLRSRLVVPFKERDRGHCPAQFAQKPFFKLSRPVDNELAARNITQKMIWTVDFDGFFRLGDRQVEGEAFLRNMLEFVRPAHLLEH